MIVQKLIGFIFSPLAFSIGFLGPLIAQTLSALDVAVGVPNLVIGLVLGGALGVVAQIRGSWVWVKP